MDAHGYLHRAYHALPPLTTSRGEPVGALFGFAKMMLKVLRQHKPDGLVVCFDAPGPTFRHKAYEAYKAHRKPIESELKKQLPLAQDLTRAWGWPTAVLPGYEADDLIATFATLGEKNGWRVVVVTGDKDALQLVNDNVSVWNEAKNLTVDPAEVEKKYGLTPSQLVDYFALTGDASDNVPGVPGVGEKTATKLLQTHKTLDALYEHLDSVPGAQRDRLREHRDDAWMSRDLVRLDRAVPVDLKLEDCSPGSPTPVLRELLQRFEFNSLLSETSAVSVPGTPTAVAPSPLTVRLVASESDWGDLKKVLSRPSRLSLDIETTGLDPLSCDLVGVSLAVKEGEGWYIAVRGVGTPVWPLERLVSTLGPVLADPAIPKVGHNLKFDSQILERHGLPVRGLSFDTMIASYCLNPGRPSHGLKPLALEMLGEAMTSIDALIGSGARQITMDQVPVTQAAPYAAADAEVPLRLMDRFAPELAKQSLNKLFHDVEMPLVPILARMEQNGIAVDRGYLADLSVEFEKSILALEGEIHRLAGESFNVNSPKQLATILFEKLGLPVVRRTKTGFSTDEEVLRKLAPQHPLPDKMLVMREWAKLKSTYIDGLLAVLRPGTDRVHTRFNQTGTATGRLSSTDPNLQNIPIRTEEGRRIRHAFVAAPGTVFLSADYSQIDLRSLAHVSNDPALVKAFLSGEDIHAATARDIFGLETGASVSDDQRRIAKSVNFGIVYGQTGFGLSQQLGIPLDQAQRYIQRYFEKYAGVKTWVEQTLRDARRDGRVTTLLGRIRYLPDINASNGNIRAFAERTAMNTPIQGTSADIIKVAMREVARQIESSGHEVKMLLQVHDDLLFEISKALLSDWAPRIKKIMEEAVPLRVPVVVDLKSGTRWDALEKIRA